MVLMWVSSLTTIGVTRCLGVETGTGVGGASEGWLELLARTEKLLATKTAALEFLSMRELLRGMLLALQPSTNTRVFPAAFFSGRDLRLRSLDTDELRE